MSRIVTIGHAIARALPHLGAYDVLAAADEVDGALPAVQSSFVTHYEPEYLLLVASGSREVTDAILDRKKIQAIKALRTLLPGSGLKECKDAVDALDTGNHPISVRGLAWHNWSSDEPPF